MHLHLEICSITADDEGAFTELVGDWTFIPAYLGEDEMSMLLMTATEWVLEKTTCLCAYVAMADKEYEHFGWWTMCERGW